MFVASVYVCDVFLLLYFKSPSIWPIVCCLVPDIIVMKRGTNLTSYSRIKTKKKHFLLIRDKAIWMEFDYINFN